MSVLNVAAFFPFRRVKLSHQSVDAETTLAHIHAEPDKRFQPVCHRCGNKASGVHSWTQRPIRDLNLATAQVWVNIRYRKLFCPTCRGIHIEDLGLFNPYLRVTHRLADYIYQLCQVMTVTDVAEHLQLDWKTVKAIDKEYLERDFGQPDYQGLRILAVDEISLRKGHNYLTVVLDYITGRVLHVGKDRKARTLKRFFNMLSISRRKRIEAVAMDMWDPFIKAVKKNCPMPGLSSICSMSLPVLGV